MMKQSREDGRVTTETKEQIAEAAFETLRREGFAGTSARAIARTGGFNSALIFYYFGSVNGALLAALDHSSEKRMERYSQAVEAASSFEELVEVARRIYREDLQGGHITAFSELVGASLANPELRPEIVARSEPWIDFVESTITKALKDTPLVGMLPARELAQAVIAFYLGVNLLTHLDEDDARVSPMFDLATQVAPLLSRMLNP